MTEMSLLILYIIAAINISGTVPGIMGTVVVVMFCGGIVVPYGDGWQMNVVAPCCRCMWVSGCNIVIDKACNRTEPDDPDDGEENLEVVVEVY